MNYGFVKLGTAIPSLKVADCAYNAKEICNIIDQARERDVEILLFPELCVTAYSCGDLLSQKLLLQECYLAIEKIMQHSAESEIISIIGAPIELEGTLLNCAVVIQGGIIRGIVPKIFLPNYREFYEQRWFASGNDIPKGTTLAILGQEIEITPYQIFKTPRCTFGIEICEDLWSPIPPSSYMALRGAEVIFNLSADNESIGKHDYLIDLIKQQSARCLCAYIFSSCGFGESSSDVVFAGNAIITENGSLIAESKRFSLTSQLITSEVDVERLRGERMRNTTFAASRKLHCHESIKQTFINQQTHHPITITRKFDSRPFVPRGRELDERCSEIFSIQACALAKRLKYTGAKNAVIGISGGLDSTLALLVTAEAFDYLKMDRSGIIGVTMPGFGTTSRTYTNAIDLMKSLRTTIREISIKEACIQHFNDIGHDIENRDITYENSQARERTQILMDIANQCGGLVIGTGDLSELALGWATYNGDHMSMYGVNGSVPKTLVKHLVTWIANNSVEEKSRATLFDIVDTPISPELIPADEKGNISQKTEELVGPYELHDFFLYYFLRFGFTPSKIYFLAKLAFEGKYENETIKKWLTTFLRRFFSQQFKRSCLPDGPKVGSCSLSPRGDWRMPSDASSEAWIQECEKLI